MKRILISSLSILMLSACGGGGGNSSGGNGDGNTTLTGQVSGISGLSFKTINTDDIETRSGVINQNNEFEYEDGETITLYLGGAELASATASTNMNLFDFFPNLPDDAATLRKQLRQPFYSRERLQAVPRGSYYTKNQSTPLDRASNIMRLLLALDEDQDSTNGIDLLTDDWITKLANESDVSLNLDANMFEFSDSQAMLAFQHTYSLSINMDISEPLATLYDMAQVTIPTQRREGYNSQGLTPPNSGTYEYDDQQRIIKEVKTTSYEYLQDGTPPNHRIYTYEYDAKGNLLKDFYEADVNDNQIINSYNRKTYTYNDFGKVESLIYDYDQDTDSNAFRRTVSNNFYENDAVLLKSSTQKTDNTGDNTYDIFYETKYEYDNNHVVESIQDNKLDASGELLSISSRTSYSYNEDYQITQYNYEKSFSGETASATDRYDFTYDGNTVTSTINYITLNAPLSSPSNKGVFTETFDEDGLVTKRTKAVYVNNALDGSGEVSYSYDANNRITQCQFQFDNTGDEQFNYAQKYDYAYDDNGITSIGSQHDYDGDGVFTVDSESYTAQYGDNSQVLNETTDSLVFNYSTDTINDGVRYLIHEFLYLDRDILIRHNDAKCFLNLSSGR
jgi:hypothetical protein